MVLLIAIAYTCREEKSMGIQKYIGRLKRQGEMSDSTAALYWSNLGQFVEQCADVVAELMILGRNKKYYQKGLRAMELILSTL